MSDEVLTPYPLPDALLWLADAPLFIDAEFLERFYDAVVKPESKVGKTTLTITDETIRRLKGAAHLKAEVSAKPNDLFKAIASFFPFLNIEAKVGGDIGGEGSTEQAQKDAQTVELFPIETPQRQLVQLALHYTINHPERLFLVSSPADESWRAPATIQRVPRQVVFLEVPGQEEASQLHQPETKLIPTAAEFADGKVVPLYGNLRKKNGEHPPSYPEWGARSACGKLYNTADALQNGRKAYWQWFDENFSAQQAVEVVEEATFTHGRIRWIDYRLPIAQDGSTLHLHLCPSSHYDTGIFAYNFIKRGLKHGLRLIGTLKSEPDMNVLAIYEK
jgi:hypothetical protein